MTVPQIGFIVRGQPGGYPGSAQVRVIRRVLYEARREAVHARQLNVQSILDGTEVPVEAVLVQRDALGPVDPSVFIRVVRSWGARLVVEVDDDFFSNRGVERLLAAEYDCDSLTTLHAVVEAADQVIVSTSALKEVVSRLTPRVTVVPNALDISLWSGHDYPHAQRGKRVLYMGSTTHGSDLELLEPVFDDLVTRAGMRVELDVIGVTQEAQSWYNRIEIPHGRHHYPEFASWLAAKQSRWMIGVAPLTDEPFNIAKSDIKFLEYSALSLATVASRSRAYDGIDQHGGRLVPSDSAEAWREAITFLLDHPIARLRSTVRARRYLRKRRAIRQDDGWLGAVLGVGHR